MRARIKHYAIFMLGWLSVVVAFIAALLPVLPATPFLILAVACFAETSPKFHAMLINNRWIGPPLKQWDQTKTVRKRTKYQAVAMLAMAFSLSIGLLWGKWVYQLVLLSIAAVMIGFVLKLDVAEPKYDD